MAEIRFHTLNAAGGGARFRHACKLIEQAYLAGERVLVWLDDPGTSERFDQLLWTFRDGAFVPHEPLAEAGNSEAPVQLFSGDTLGSTVLDGGFTTLVNLRDAPSPEALGFPRILEVLDGEASCREAGRARFRFYREAGSTPQHIAVTDED
ncbi:MAG TPA: DNA polymerase III subunit chi [Steroidobacteraceae bacterium]|nr:DNA polymerase III subunit chi [Steroidobacteraceae bacterium]